MELAATIERSRWGGHRDRCSSFHILCQPSALEANAHQTHRDYLQCKTRESPGNWASVHGQKVPSSAGTVV
jgi:hypothetical protein